MDNKQQAAKAVITATIQDYWYDPFHHCYVGKIYNDIRQRFPDGKTIHTSRIMRDIDKDGILITRNSTYKMLLPTKEEAARQTHKILYPE